MEISEENVDGVAVLSLSGRLDSNTAAATEQEVLRLTDGTMKSLVIDCTNMPYTSSAGLRVLLIAAKRMKATTCKLSLAGLRSEERRVGKEGGRTCSSRWSP